MCLFLVLQKEKYRIIETFGKCQNYEHRFVVIAKESLALTERKQCFVIVCIAGLSVKTSTDKDQ